MSSTISRIFTRRAVVASAVAWMGLLDRNGSGNAQSMRPAPVAIGHGLEIRDYRLFPTEGVMRFIVEIHNTTDTAIDTPSVGVVFPHIKSNINFAMAVPVAMVLNPKSSELLIGVAPAELTSDDDWGEPQWELCNPTTTRLAEKLRPHELEFHAGLHLTSLEEGNFYINITNPTASPFVGWVLLQPLIWDRFGRICGVSPISGANGVEPNTTVTTVSRINSKATYYASPFTLIDSLEDVTVTFSQQPGRLGLYNDSCTSVLPWND